MAGIGIITNPHSRRNRRYPEQMRRLGYVLGEDDSYEMTNRIEDVARVAEQFKKSNIDILALNGGDGTNHVTLSTFIEVYGDTPLPRITFLRGGTMNTISNGIGIKGKPSRLLANLVEKYYTKQPFETTRRDMLKVTDSEDTRYGFIFGNGVVSNFLEAYYDTGHPTPTTAAVLLSKAIVGLPFGGHMAKELMRPFTAQLDFGDGESLPRADYTSVLAATIDQIGLGFRPFVRCEEKPGTFHLLALTAGPAGIVRELPAIRVGRPISPESGLSRVCDSVTIRAEDSITYTIDGDMHTSDGPVTLAAGPRVEIIVK